MIRTVAAAFFKRGAQEALSYRTSTVLQLFGVMTAVVSLLFLSRFISQTGSPLLARYGGRYLPFSFAGLVLLNLQHTVLSAYPTTIRTSQLAGTLEAMLATPTPAWLVLLCAPIYRIATATAASVLALLIAAVWLRGGGLLSKLPFVLAGLALAPVAFASLGFFAATLTMLLRRSDPFSLLVSGLSTLAGGVFYPTSVLPAWLRAAGHLLPITQALELVRRAAFGSASNAELVGALLALVATCAVIAPVGLLSFVWAVRHARRDGSLAHY